MSFATAAWTMTFAVSRMQLARLAVDALAGVSGRPARATWTGVGVAAAVAGVSILIGLVESGGTRIDDRFLLAASEFVTIRTEPGSAPLPGNAVDRALTVATVTAAAQTAVAEDVSVSVRSQVHSRSEVSARLVRAGPELSEAVGLDISPGCFFDAGHAARGDRVAVVGRALAERLGGTIVDGKTAISIDGRPHLILGIVDHAPGDSQLLGSVTVPAPKATTGGDLALPNAIHLRADPSLIATVAEQVSLLLTLERPRSLIVNVDPGAPALRSGVEQEIGQLVWLVALLGTAVSALVVSTAMTTNVLERTPEIGLRRSLGASRQEIGLQFVFEATIIGATGGAVGLLTAAVVLTVGAAAFAWQPVLDPSVAWFSWVWGVMISVLAALRPAVRAANVDPMSALLDRA